MRAANLVTLGRILAIPLFIGALYLPIRGKDWIAAAVFAVLALSDTVDGWLARKLNQRSDFGALLDPIADKLLVSAALVFLIGQGIPAWMAYVIIAREFLVTGLRLAVRKDVVVSASVLGKLKTWSQVIAVLAVLTLPPAGYWLMLLATTLTVVSGADYIIAMRKHIKEEL
jgi:CDP-diacylglycerol--glycerol-3-phosphate 3-phosphatidyltransferase